MRLLVLALLLLLAGSAQAQTDQLSSRAYDPATIADLPPWPGALPAQFANEAEYERTLQGRLDQLNLRADGLTTLGKPPRTRHKLAGWLTVGAGLTLFGLSAIGLDDPRSHRASRTWMGVGIAGGLVVVTGFVVMLSAPRNVYRHEIRDLRRAATGITKEIRRVKWERRQAQVNLSTGSMALTIKF